MPTSKVSTLWSKAALTSTYLQSWEIARERPSGKHFNLLLNVFFLNFLFITLTWYDPRPDEVCLVAHQDDGLVAGHVPDLAEVVKDCLGCGKTCLLGKAEHHHETVTLKYQRRNQENMKEKRITTQLTV